MRLNGTTEKIVEIWYGAQADLYIDNGDDSFP